MPHCCVPQCKNRSESHPYLSFYRFPSDPVTKKKWIVMIQREDFKPTPNTRVCSWHFPRGKEQGPTRFHWSEDQLDNDTSDKVKEDEQPKIQKKHVKYRKYIRKGIPQKKKAEVNEEDSLDLLASVASVMSGAKLNVPDGIKRDKHGNEIIFHDTAKIEKYNFHAYVKREELDVNNQKLKLEHEKCVAESNHKEQTKYHKFVYL